MSARCPSDVEHTALAERPFPRLRIVATFLNARQRLEVAPLGIDAQQDVDAIA